MAKLNNGMDVNEVIRSATALIKAIDGKEKIVRFSGWDWRNQSFVYDCIGGGGSLVHTHNVIAILDNEVPWYESPIYLVADFYQTWKEKGQLVCPCCKKSFVFKYQFINDKKCFNCKHENGHTSKEFNFVELTDEMVFAHNAKCIHKSYKGIFEGNVAGARVSDDMPEFLMNHGHDLAKLKDYITEDQLTDLRHTFKKCYGIALRKIAERKALQ